MNAAQAEIGALLHQRHRLREPAREVGARADPLLTGSLFGSAQGQHRG
jgi:hypothetical protein